jgi:hypothetical protein
MYYFDKNYSKTEYEPRFNIFVKNNEIIKRNNLLYSSILEIDINEVFNHKNNQNNQNNQYNQYYQYYWLSGWTSMTDILYLNLVIDKNTDKNLITNNLYKIKLKLNNDRYYQIYSNYNNRVYQYDLEKIKYHPSSFDLRNKGLISPVNNFSVNGFQYSSIYVVLDTLETQYKIKTGLDISLSREYLIECLDKKILNNPNLVYDYIITKGIITSEKYNSLVNMINIQNNKNKKNNIINNIYSICDVNVNLFNIMNNTKSRIKFNEVINITRFDKDGLKDALINIGSLSVVMSINENFINYVDGIYNSSIGDNNQYFGSGLINKNKYKHYHNLLLVGYNITDNGQEYYILKNNWGTDWGIGGYIYWNKNDAENNMITEFASYPNLIEMNKY